MPRFCHGELVVKYEYIAIEGNIGAGKTSLAHKLAAHYNGRLVLEEFAENPFLPPFYKNPDRYAFPLELSFLAERFAQLKSVLSTRDLFGQMTIGDYFLSKSLIFARSNLNGDELNLFLQLYQIMEPNLPNPDLLVFLYLDVRRLQENIRKRGRSYEQAIEDNYLDDIQQSYFEFLKQRTDLRVLLIDTANLDFVNREEDFASIVDLLEQDYPKGITRIRP